MFIHNLFHIIKVQLKGGLIISANEFAFKRITLKKHLRKGVYHSFSSINSLYHHWSRANLSTLQVET